MNRGQVRQRCCLPWDAVGRISLANGPAGVLYGMGQARATFRINLTKGPVLVAACSWDFVGRSARRRLGVRAGRGVVLPAWVLTLRHSLRSAAGAQLGRRWAPWQERHDPDGETCR